MFVLLLWFEEDVMDIISEGEMRLIFAERQKNIIHYH